MNKFEDRSPFAFVEIYCEKEWPFKVLRFPMAVAGQEGLDSFQKTKLSRNLRWGGTRVDRVGNPINLEAPVLSRYERRKINNFVAACSVTFPRRGGRRSLISRRNPRLRPPFLFLFVCNLDWNKILSTVKRNRILGFRGCNKKIFNSRGLKYWKVRRVEGNIQHIFP